MILCKKINFNASDPYQQLNIHDNFVVLTSTPAPVDSNTIQIAFIGNGVYLSWISPAPESNSNMYVIYRGKTPDFNIATAVIVGEVKTTNCTDPITTPGTYYYKIIVVDISGNASGPSSAVSIVVPWPVWTYIVIGIIITVVIWEYIFLRKSLEKKRSLVRRSPTLVDNTQDEMKNEKSPDDEIVWKDISAGAWSTNRIESTKSKFENHSAPPVKRINTPSPASSQIITDPISHFDQEMQELYHNAEEFLRDGQDRTAFQVFEILLHLAEKKNDPIAISFIKSKMDKL